MSARCSVGAEGLIPVGASRCQIVADPAGGTGFSILPIGSNQCQKRFQPGEHISPRNPLKTLAEPATWLLMGQSGSEIKGWKRSVRVNRRVTEIARDLTTQRSGQYTCLAPAWVRCNSLLSLGRGPRYTVEHGESSEAATMGFLIRIAITALGFWLAARWVAGIWFPSKRVCGGARRKPRD